MGHPCEQGQCPGGAEDACTTHCLRSGATLSASLLVVPMYRSEGNADWALPGWRLVALLIGFAIMALVSGVLFPVSARSIARRRLAAALGDVAGVCSRLQAEVSAARAALLGRPLERGGQPRKCSACLLRGRAPPVPTAPARWHWVPCSLCRQLRA